MTWSTHTLFGISTLWLLAPLPPALLGCDFGTLAAFAALGALLPDLDASESKVKHLKILGTQIKPFLPLSQFVSRTDQHRGLLHSHWGIGLAALIALPLAFVVGWASATALLLGYISHLIADAATKSGIRLRYPHPQRCYLLPKEWRITTGSMAEEVLMALLLFPVLSLLLLLLFTSA